MPCFVSYVGIVIFFAGHFVLVYFETKADLLRQADDVKCAQLLLPIIVLHFPYIICVSKCSLYTFLQLSRPSYQIHAISLLYC